VGKVGSRLLGEEFDGHVGCRFFDERGRIYFTTRQGVNTNLYRLSLENGTVKQITDLRGVMSVTRDKDSGLCLINFTDPENPTDLYLAESGKISKKSNWTKLTDANPFVRELEIADYETVGWPSSDGRIIEGILIKPRKGKGPWPLIVQIHGGPASAVQNGFSGSAGYYANVFTGAGYAVFQPNYRGSEAYGQDFRTQIAGDYFRQAYDDIISGVDHLIEKGVAHPDSLGFMGWSAGGHWSNWTLVSTDRFKAISSGAGAVNWVSLYAQTDVQATREFYFEGMPYNNWDHYLQVSPIKYIKQAKTPTLIHFGEKDERIPKPQGDELYMALKKLGVPTEYIVYPGMPHGLTRPHFQLVKMKAEFAWFQKWIRGVEGWIDWQAVLDTMPPPEEN
jgi:dipeptidyl aminopeptidase/acylaminoacyl peptidase